MKKPPGSQNRTIQAGDADPGEQACFDERLQSATNGSAPRTWLTVTDVGAAVLLTLARRRDRV